MPLPVPLTAHTAQGLMTTSLGSTPWDFSHVRDLVEKLSARPDDTDYAHPKYKELNANDALGGSAETALRKIDIDEKDFAISTPEHIHGGASSPRRNGTIVSSTGLGDFSRIFDLLVVPQPPPILSLPKETADADKSKYVVPAWEQYASDGAAYVKPTARQGAAMHQADLPSADETLTDRTSDGMLAHGQKPKLTKKQAKKLRQKEKLEQRKRAITLSAGPVAEVFTFESEAEIDAHAAPARRASMHAAKSAAAKNDKLTPKHTTTKLTKTSQPIINTTEVVSAPGEVSEEPTSSSAPRTPTLKPRHPQDLEATQSASNQNIRLQTGTHFETPGISKTVIKFLPSSVPPKPLKVKVISNESRGKQDSRPSPAFKVKQLATPLMIRSVEDRNWALLMKLINDFWKDRTYLISPMNLTTHNNDPKGIHVFVDASNIFIGFLEQLKRARGIPQHFHLPATGLSFDAIALLMERRRPVAKRVLVGSTPHIPAFDKAKAVGYECSILEKVYKARELTERQKYFKALDERYSNRTKVPSANNVASANGNGNGLASNESGSETTAVQLPPPRMMEQGVDEILHLKILESVVDTDEPATIVLATGDAALAEYSQGFMAMAERALKKGWTVELVTWSHLVSSMYKRRKWTEAWGESFKIIYLDDYVEELLDM